MLIEYHMLSEEHLQAIAETLAKIVSPPLSLFLYGELGAGKTTFCRSFIQALGVQGRIKSPTYGLIECYEHHDINVLHLDLYRLELPEELIYLGLEDYLTDTTILLVEWPEKAHHYLPPHDMDCRLEIADSHRNLFLEAKSARGVKILEALKTS